MRHSLLILWAAGFTPSAATIMSSMFEIGFNDEVREKLIAKLDEFGTEADGKVEVTHQQVATRIPLLDSYLLAILRWYPGKNGVNREVSEDIEILGSFVARGRNAFCDFNTARHENILHPDASSFKFERFL